MDTYLGTKSERFAMRILKEREGFESARKIYYIDVDIEDPKPDILAYKDGVKYIVEVKTFRPSYYKLATIAQAPERLDFIMVLDMFSKYYMLLNPAEYFNGQRYNIYPRRLKLWKPFDLT